MNSGQLLMLPNAYAYSYKAFYDSRSVSSQCNAADASSQRAGQTTPQTAGPQFSHASQSVQSVQSVTGDCVNTMDSGRSRCCRAATDLSQQHLSATPTAQARLLWPVTVLVL